MRSRRDSRARRGLGPNGRRAGGSRSATSRPTSMRKIFHFDSPREKYRCDASVVSCFDNRFDAVSRKLLKRIGVVQPDAIRIAGGAKALASPEEEFDRAFVLEQIRKSIRLHETERAILMLHSDCGAYGGLAARFRRDPEAEAAH